MYQTEKLLGISCSLIRGKGESYWKNSGFKFAVV